MKIIIAPDSFKGSLTSLEAASAMEQGVRQVIPDAETDLLPMADGGEGTMQVLVASTEGHLKEVECVDPLGRPIRGQYGLLGDGKTAIVEMAAASGLLLLKKEERNPLFTTTYGTGVLIQDALESGCRKLIIGIGGSSTNDCGTGLAQALGIRFFAYDKSEITDKMCGGLLGDVASIDLSDLHPAIRHSQITVACDVTNPLLGKQGCAHVYARQKGATNKSIDRLEKNMTQFIDIAEKTTGKSVRHLPGSGAAGGLGAGLMLFLDAELQAGIDIVMETCNFSERIKNADVILTGEGKIDDQTAYGKTITGIGSRAGAQNIPVIAFAGRVEHINDLHRFGITRVVSIRQKTMPVQAAMADASELLIKSVSRFIKSYNRGLS